MPGRTTTYLQFAHHLPKPPRKTYIVHIRSVRTTELLGMIKWYGPWRQYCFYPVPDTIWNTECMEEIQAEIKMLMDARQ